MSTKLDELIAEAEEIGSAKRINSQSAQSCIRRLVAVVKDAKEMVQHFIAMEALTPGGSNEGWANQWLNGESFAAGEKGDGDESR
jgi:hypothetical protein